MNRWVETSRERTGNEAASRADRWTGSADSTITSEAVMAIAEKFNTGEEVCFQIPSARGVMQVKDGTSGS